MNTPPFSQQAEQGLIGSLMLLDYNDKKALEAIDIVRPEMFYAQSHQEIYRAIIKCKARDLITITDELEKSGRLDDCGGFAYVGQLCHGTPSAASIINYAEIVAEKYHAREMLGIFHSGAEMVYSKEGNQHILDHVSNSISKIDLSGGYDPHHVKDLAMSFVDKMEARHRGDQRVIGLPTGISRLDEDIVGMGNDWLITLFGRPSNGKTLISQYIASKVSATKPVQYFTMEMSGDEIMERFVGVMAGINPKKLKTADLTDYEWAKISEVLSRFKNSENNVYYDEEPNLALNQIRHRVKTTIKKKGELGLVVIDYLGLMQRPKADRDDLSIGIITRGLKQLAKETQTPILLLAQANRGSDKEHRPTMANIYGSSAVEADSDLILAVHREDVYDDKTALKGVTEVIPIKFRHGDLPGTSYLRPNQSGVMDCLTDEQVGMIMHQEELGKKESKKSRF